MAIFGIFTNGTYHLRYITVTDLRVKILTFFTKCNVTWENSSLNTCEQLHSKSRCYKYSNHIRNGYISIKTILVRPDARRHQKPRLRKDCRPAKHGQLGQLLPSNWCVWTSLRNSNLPTNRKSCVIKKRTNKVLSISYLVKSVRKLYDSNKNFRNVR